MLSVLRIWIYYFGMIYVRIEVRCEFSFVCAKFPGSVNDARILRESHLPFIFNSNLRPFLTAKLIGDSAFPRLHWLRPVSKNPDEYEAAHNKFYMFILGV